VLDQMAYLANLSIQRLWQGGAARHPLKCFIHLVGRRDQKMNIAPEQRPELQRVAAGLDAVLRVDGQKVSPEGGEAFAYAFHLPQSDTAP
jgi:hypothetical protein